ncbi:hypothetical protein QBC34DRAFT_381301 [Podospora aff. communis PSN243]|uniref:Ankyrin n=1 Tax=Podospora aff. communis PSN243 TaxID=3040156 RepID=A0AAV9GM76_9PEZI|nr:hypothetical protein QBC34DRAFT_381301 [Podospora aff. communis PSN243]
MSQHRQTRKRKCTYGDRVADEYQHDSQPVNGYQHYPQPQAVNVYQQSSQPVNGYQHYPQPQAVNVYQQSSQPVNGYQHSSQPRNGYQQSSQPQAVNGYQHISQPANGYQQSSQPLNGYQHAPQPMCSYTNVEIGHVHPSPVIGGQPPPDNSTEIHLKEWVKEARRLFKPATNREMDTEMMKEMLARSGVDKCINEWGWTELHFAAYEGRTDDVRSLLAQGASPYVENVNGHTPYDLALLMNDADSAYLLSEAY